MGEETWDSQHEICTNGARNPPCARGEGESVLGGEYSLANLALSRAIERDPCPSGAGIANSSIYLREGLKSFYSQIRASWEIFDLIPR